MFRLTLKNLLANRLRFVLTTFAVVLAVSFVVSSFVLTDGLRSTFGDLSEEIVEGTDLQVRPVADLGDPPPLDPALLDEVAAIDGVAVAAPLIEATENAIRPINADGDAISTSGPPQLAFGWVDAADISPFEVVVGSAPDEPGEFAMGIDAANDNGFDVGETYDVITPTGRSQLTLTALTSFGADNDTLGATLMQFDVDDLQALTGRVGYDAIDIALADGADRSTVQRAVADAVPGAEVVDNATLEAEQKDEFNEGIDIIGNVLLGFAGVSLFVSVFIIYNTFSIVLGQRTRELALLRTIGADPVQLRRSVQGEAALIGVLASAVGIAAGVGVAFGLRALFGVIGADLPDSPTVISLRTVLVACLVGIGVTVIAAVGPARKASRVPAIAALRDGAAAGEPSGRRRLLIGGALLAAGLGAGAVGLFGGGSTSTIVTLLAVGGAGVFIGITMLSHLLVQPLTAATSWPLRRVSGVAGKLAGENSARNPRRTSTTAAALMIGLALVSMALTVGESVKAQLRATLDSSVQADYLITEGFSEAGFPESLASALGDVEVTETVTSFRYDDARIGGVAHEVVATDQFATAELFDFGIVDGAAHDASVSDPVLVSDDEAAATGLAVGDTIAAEFVSGATRDLTVIGVFSDDVIIEEDYVLDLSTWGAVDGTRVDSWIALSTVDGTTDAEAAAAFAPISADYPQADIDTSGDYVRRLEGFVDQALAALNVMVALAVIIALIGIANTLALSVFERTRELGLLRAVGMTRRQLRRMVRFEAGLVALFGAVLGVVTGIGFGWAAVLALPASVTDTVAIPTGRILILVAVAAGAGLLAARGPAKRAGKMDVLQAISS